MNKIYTLKNGLKLVFCKDSSKKRIYAELIVKYGGIHSTFIKNQKQYQIEDGMAHFLEHLLIEHSMYGNLLTYFHNNYIKTNGITSTNFTRFYIHTVHDFEENLIKLIKMVNVPVFNKEDIEETKPAILEEIKKSYDSKFRNLAILNKKCLFNNIPYLNNLGTEEFIQKLTYEEVKMCYEIFYQPCNQVLAIAGNIDIDKIIKLIENIYKEIERPKIKYYIPHFLEPNEVVKKEDYIYENVSEKFVNISYKINLNDFSSYEKVKGTFYFNYYLDYNFGESSNAYKELIEKKISVNNINYSYYLIDQFLIIEFSTYTSKEDCFIQLIMDKINQKEFNEEDFNLRKNNSIISLILREENPLHLIQPFIDNIISFGYEKMDTIEDIENYDFVDFKDTINRLDFSHYIITKLLPK